MTQQHWEAATPTRQVAGKWDGITIKQGDEEAAQHKGRKCSLIATVCHCRWSAVVPTLIRRVCHRRLSRMRYRSCSMMHASAYFATMRARNPAARTSVPTCRNTAAKRLVELAWSCCCKRVCVAHSCMCCGHRPQQQEPSSAAASSGNACIHQQKKQNQRAPGFDPALGKFAGPES